MHPKISAKYAFAIKSILSLYREIEKETRVFRKLSGIKCPDECGLCCATASVEATVKELLPLALFLWKNGRAIDVLDSLKKKSPEEVVCFFFKKDNAAEWKGRCMMYLYRPLLCRLFAFYPLRDKTNKIVFTSCRTLKTQCFDGFETARNLVDKGMHNSTMSDYFMRLNFICPEMESKLLPINQAITKAIEIIGFDIYLNDRFPRSAQIRCRKNYLIFNV